MAFLLMILLELKCMHEKCWPAFRWMIPNDTQVSHHKDVARHGKNLNFTQRAPMTECCSTNTDSFRVSIACVSQQVDFVAAQSSNNPTPASLGEDSDDVKQAVT